MAQEIKEDSNKKGFAARILGEESWGRFSRSNLITIGQENKTL